MSRFISIDWEGNQAYLIAGRLRGAGQVDVEQALTWTDPEPHLSNPQQAGQNLRTRLREAGIAPAPVLACVGRGQFVVKEIRFPAVPELEEPAVIRFQAIKELADSPDEVIIDYVVRSQPDDPEKRAAAVALRKKTLEAYQTICKAAGLKLAAVTPRLIGVMISLRKVMGTTVVTPAPEPPEGAYCVVLSGDQQSEVAILKETKFLLSRSVPVGPGLPVEVRRNLMVHAGNEPNNPVVAVYVGGKGSGELRERIAEIIGDVPVHTFDPFAGAEGAGGGQLPTGNRGLFSGPMGLLQLRAAGDLPINFVSPRQATPPANPNVARLRLVGLVVVALVIGLFALGMVMLNSAQSQYNDLEAQLEQAETDLKAAEARHVMWQAIENRDVPPALDEMWDLVARADLKQVRFTKWDLSPLPRTDKSRFVARLTLIGQALPSTPAARRQAYDTLANQFKREGYYSVNNTLSKFIDPQFTLVVDMERRPPSSYTHMFDDPTKVKSSSTSTTSGKTRSR